MKAQAWDKGNHLQLEGILGGIHPYHSHPCWAPSYLSVPGDADHTRDFAEVPEGNHQWDEQHRAIREVSEVPDILGKWSVGPTRSHLVLLRAWKMLVPGVTCALWDEMLMYFPLKRFLLRQNKELHEL